MTGSKHGVDTARRPSLSFARPECPAAHASGGSAPAIAEREPVREASGLVFGAQRDELNGFPVQAAKVQRPPLRDDVLARDRLLDWLHVKIHHRLVLVLAEAGYGKTTLLADFAGRTRLRTLWYRLDEDDRDWVTLLHHLVASGREVDPGFAPRTATMLADSGVTGPSRDAVLDTFLREFAGIAEHGAVLILDDLHLVDDAPDAKVVVRELVTRAPERVSIVIASRRPPSISVAKLRAAGEVAELRTNDLRFDSAETARLFSESYGRPLEADVLAELSARTEGWAASLQLVQAALRDRSPAEIRRFVRNLTGADQELYDYLAEEVVGELPDDLQQFLMRTSILQVVRPDLAEAVTGLSPAEVRTLTATAERFSLLGRRGSTHRDQLRYHPLVRDFLETRLERSVSDPAEVEALHRSVASAVEARDWRVACHHYAAIGDEAGVLRTIDAAVEEIVARGDALVAETFLEAVGPDLVSTAHEVIRSRADMRRGDHHGGLQRAWDASRANPTSPIAIANLASAAQHAGDYELAEAASRQLVELEGESDLGNIGRGLLTILHASRDGDLRVAVRDLHRLRDSQHNRGHVHYEGITLLNIAVLERMRGDASSALEAAAAAVWLLQDDRNDPETSSAQAAQAWALAHMGDMPAARSLMTAALRAGDDTTRGETLLEAADIELVYGSLERGSEMHREAARHVAGYPGTKSLYDANAVFLAVRNGELADARAVVDGFSIGTFAVLPSGMAQQLFLRAYVSCLEVQAGSSDLSEARGEVEAAIAHAQSQDAGLWVAMGTLVRAVLDGTMALRAEIRRLSEESPSTLSALAELLVSALSTLDTETLRLLLAEVKRRPDRWLPTLRTAVDRGGDHAIQAGVLLEEIGTESDVAILRRLSRLSHARANTDLGRALARRVAPRVDVSDQGRVVLHIGARTVEGSAVRRKVLTLLCFLLTRPRFSATRDEVLEALWPEFDPGVALNSLNQTIYFLRRVFEPNYLEDTSPGYVRHDSELVWLDRQLVSSRSQRCLDFVRALPPQPSPEQVQELVGLYRGPFALDFAYEEWAVTFRENLHAAFLQIIETAVMDDIATGHFARGIVFARAALAVEPRAEQIELSLLRLLRLTGAHAAAAEQYSHYASLLRDELGVDPPPLEAL